jgi:hypothetical protein
MTHMAVTGYNAVMTMPYCPLPMQALVDSLSSAIDCVSNQATFLRLFIFLTFCFIQVLKFLCLIFFSCVSYTLLSLQSVRYHEQETEACCCVFTDIVGCY